jgi:DNA protecting protein DprA
MVLAMINGNMISFSNLSKDKKLLYWVAFTTVKGWGPYIIRNLFTQFYSVSNILEQIRQKNPEIPYVDNAYKTIFLDHCNIAESIVEKTYQFDAKIVTLEDELFPKNIKNLSSLPPVLYYKGSLNSLSIKSLAVVGTTKPTNKGLDNAATFARYCVENKIQVISGLARGIDTAAHKSTLKNKGTTFAVIGHGIDYIYPAENKELFFEIAEKGAVISQFPTGNKPAKWQFPMRNELMCTLASGTVIIEAVNDCGSVIQADYSFKHNRAVYVLHNNVNNKSDDYSWSRKLLKQGAVLVTSFKDIKVVLPQEISKLENQLLSHETISDQKSLLDFNEKQDMDLNKAILFDLDGVLVDTSDCMKRAYKRAADELGKTISDSEIEGYLKKSPNQIFKMLGIDIKNGNYLYRKYYQEYLSFSEFFPQIDNVIKLFKTKGFKVGIVTSQPSSRYHMIMRNAPFAKHIDVAITWNDIPRGKSKPHPDGINKALEKLNVVPGKTFFVGDTVNDLIAAKNANVKSVAVLWGLEKYNELVVSNPDYIFKDVSDLKKLAEIPL